MTPGRVDRRVVDRHLAALRQALAGLRRHASVSPQSLRTDSDRRWVVERGLQLCAQNALDIASHLGSAAGLDPATYSSSIDCLVEAHVLPPEFAARFRGIAGFRNVLVHGYLDVDLDRVAAMVTDHLDDFEQFARYVERCLSETVEPEPRGFHPTDAATGSVSAIGVDGCRAGWFFVALEPSGKSHWGIVRSLDKLVREAAESARIFVDIPIGLPEGPGGRECDRAARRELRAPRASSVFPAPARAVFGAADYEDAKRRSREIIGAALSRQAFAILPKCREVDQLLRTNAKARRLIREIHPEVCFWAFAGRPMRHNKKSKEGFDERIAALKQLRPAVEQEIEKVLTAVKPRDAARDDAVDAMAAALTASADGVRLRTLPPDPPIDSEGLPMEMVYVEPRTN